MIFPARIFLFLLIAFGGTVRAYADGSKDMYPSDVEGNRAFLISRTARASNVLFNSAAHYVYVREGETVAVASSAQGIGNGHIILRAPDGAVYTTQEGHIPNRVSELGGPGVGYTPYVRKVLPGQEGIWKVEFMPTRKEQGETRTTQDSPPANQRADADWIQQDVSFFIAAWDISVRNEAETEWVKGRVFTHVLNLYVRVSDWKKSEEAFYGQNYVLTKDGYIYRVDGNGSNGINFFYFVNSSGILDADGNPSYKSSNKGIGTAHRNTDIIYHNPNEPDDGEQHVTHKMFYTFPDVTMPSSSTGTVPGGSTWLYRQTQIAEIQNISVSCPEGNKNYVTAKGAFVEFETNYQGRYEVIIAPKSGAPFFPKKRLIADVHDITGPIRMKWDGLDSAGNYLPVGNYPISISVALVEGEIHFPYFDMEINPQGILIERMNLDDTPKEYAKVRWDDSAITPGSPGEETNPLVNLEGIRSDINGHKWGSYRANSRAAPKDTIAADQELYAIYGNSYNGNYGQFSFGNERAMDTWSYAADMQEVKEENITVEIADLEVVSVTADKDTIELGDVVNYTVVVRNNGPSDAVGAKFEYDLPQGFYIIGVNSDSNCGSSLISPPVNSNELRSVLDLPNGCSLTYHIQATTGVSVPGEVYGYVLATAGVVRPVGFTDPDATSSDPDIAVPGTAAEECGGACNNIKEDREVFLLEPYEERGQLALLKTVRHLDSNGSGFQEEGEQLEYTFTIRNIGFVRVRNISVEDKMLLPGVLAPPAIALEPNEETEIIYRYTITAADVARKYVENTALVFGTNPRGFDVKDVSGTGFDNDRPTRIDVDQKPVFAMVKKVVNTGTGENGQFTIGDKIVYQFDIQHAGDIAVEEIQINDAKISSENHMVAPSVISNQTQSYQLEYIITADDISNGQVQNTATLWGKDQKYGNLLTDLSGQTFEDDLPTVTRLARAPTGVEDVFVTYQGNNGLFDVLANDLVGSSSLDMGSLEIVSQPSLGSVTVQDGKILYVPTDNFVHGEDRFVYRFSDRSRLSSPDTEVKITILRTIPVAVEDHYKVGYNFRVQLKSYENDYVEYSELLRESIRITSYPRYGDIYDLGNGIFEYRPHLDYTGYDVLKYTIRDKNGNESEEATINIEVLGFFLPNTITPNGDGKNDTFRVLGTYKFDHVELEIINRFGQRIFYSADYKNDWIVPDNISDGTYFYTFKGMKNNEKPIVRKGFLLLVRKQSRH